LFNDAGVRALTVLQGDVNPHYLDNVMVVADDREVQATEDIFADNGMKLIAKGKPINREMRDRLIHRKLRKPLEDCMEVASGVTGEQCAKVAEEVLDQHECLRVLCSAPHFNPVKLLAESSFKGRLQTLLTVYAEHKPQKLHHAVGVTLLGLGLAQRVPSAALDPTQVLITASLCHDVGELYINPDYLASGAKLDPQQWRHIAAHPVVAHRLLHDLPGPCRAASLLVLEHHERLDGFGYPHGKRGAEISLGSQIVAMSEMLGGMLSGGRAPLVRADVAVKLIPGEFNRAFIDVVSQISHQCMERITQDGSFAPQDALQKAARLALRLSRMEQLQHEFADQFQRASKPFQGLIADALERLERIRRAWSSTGLDAYPPHMLTQMEWSSELGVGLEVAMILREIVWRLRELERELRLRVQNVAPADLHVLDAFTSRLDVMDSVPAESAVPSQASEALA
jgi:hypothetical protein